MQDDLWVSRAPGRLDVMGGISDYSGSLVLQMPTARACHVAAQVHPRGAGLKLWQHIRQRQVTFHPFPSVQPFPPAFAAVDERWGWDVNASILPSIPRPIGCCHRR